MRSSLFQLIAALASTSLVSAQTWTHCDPTKKDCPDDPALAGTYDHTYGGEAPDFTTLSGSDVLKYGGEDGAIFRVEKKLDAPTIVSNFYIMWGKLEVTMKAAPGGGIVSSVVLQSDDLDEVDWEWVGKDANEAQSNYFGKGNTATYDRGAFHPVDSQATFHTYGFDWTAEKLDWTIDGAVVRTLVPAAVKGDFYPQTPMQVRLGSWAAGDEDNALGTIEWSGGPINYDEGPYDMVVKEIKITDYSTGTAYRYSDRSGSWKSIESVGGAIGVGPQEGKGNQGKIPTPVAPSSPEETARGQFDSKIGLLIPTTGGASKTHSTSEPTHGSGANKAPADSSESTPSPTLPVESYSSGSASHQTLNTITNTNVHTGPGMNATASGFPTDSPMYTGDGNKLGFMDNFIIGAAGLVIGWLL